MSRTRQWLGRSMMAAIAVVTAGKANQAFEHRRACPGPDLPHVAGTPVPPSARVGLLLVSHDAAGDASIVDLASGTATYIRVGLRDPHEVAISPDGRWGIMSEFGVRRRGRFLGNRLAIIDMRARRLTRIVDLSESRGAHGVAFVPGSSHRALVTTQTSQHIVEVNAETGTIVARMSTGADGSHLVAPSPDGRWAYTGNEEDGSLTRLDLSSRALSSRMKVAPLRAEGVAVTPDGAEVWVGSNDPGNVYVVDASSGAVRDSLTGFRYPDRIIIPRDGREVLITDAGCVRIADRASRRVVGSLNSQAGSFAATPDGRVAFLAPSGRHILVADVAARAEVARLALRERPHGVAWGIVPR